MPQRHFYSLCTWYSSPTLTGQIQSCQNTQDTAHFFPLPTHFKSILERSQGSCNTRTVLGRTWAQVKPKTQHPCHWSKVSNQGRGEPRLTGSPRVSRDLTTSTKTTDFKHQDSATDQGTEGAGSSHRSVRPWHQQLFLSHSIESDCGFSGVSRGITWQKAVSQLIRDSEARDLRSLAAAHSPPVLAMQKSSQTPSEHQPP